MNTQKQILSSFIPIFKAVCAVIVFTILMVLTLALLLYKFHFNEQSIQIGIYIIYFLSNFIGGFIIGKVKREKKFLWGMGTGLVYFIFLILISCIVTQSIAFSITNFFSAALCCIFGGILGGMLS